LAGKGATSPCIPLKVLSAFGAAAPGDEHVVHDADIVTRAGVRSCLDLHCGSQIGEEHAEIIEFLIEYRPQPPFDSGHTAKESPRHDETRLRPDGNGTNGHEPTQPAIEEAMSWR
jgi:hypothetical protein